MAVVHTTEAVDTITIATSRGQLVRRLVAWVRRHRRTQLWPDALARVNALLAAGDEEAAIQQYFASVGTRWEVQSLFTVRLPAGALPASVEWVRTRRTSRAAPMAAPPARPRHAR